VYLYGVLIIGIARDAHDLADLADAVGRILLERQRAFLLGLINALGPGYLLSRRGMSAFFTGDWARAREDYEAAMALDQEVGAYWSPRI
jgi:hypothetical protein